MAENQVLQPGTMFSSLRLVRECIVQRVGHHGQHLLNAQVPRLHNQTQIF